MYFVIPGTSGVNRQTINRKSTKYFRRVLGTGSTVQFEKVFSTEIMVKVAETKFSLSSISNESKWFCRWKCWCYLIFVSEFLVVLIFCWECANYFCNYVTFIMRGLLAANRRNREKLKLSKRSTFPFFCNRLFVVS